MTASAQNIFIAWQNRADEGTLSGGSWNASLPLTNLRDRQVQKVARSTNATAASTKFDLDLGTTRPIGVVALVVHNITTAGRVRVSAAESTAAWSNTVTAPDDLANGAWTATNAAVGQNVATAGDGTSTADKLTETGAAGAHYTEQSLGTLSGLRFASAWFKAAGRTRGYLTLAVGATTAHAQFDLTAGTTSGTVGACTIRAYANGWYKVTVSNTFPSGTMTVRAGICDDSGNTSYTGNGASGLYVWRVESSTGYGLLDDSGFAQVWPAGMVAQDALEWEDDNFWFGTLPQDAREVYQSPYVYMLESQATARYWRVEVLDTGNADGYVQIGRLFLARGWSPSVNYSIGAAMSYQDPTPIEMSLSGAEFFDRRSVYRVNNFSLEYITDTEAYQYALELQRLSGISGEVLIVPDGTGNIGQRPIKSFVGRLKQIGQITQTKYNYSSATFEVKELI